MEKHVSQPSGYFTDRVLLELKNWPAHETELRRETAWGVKTGIVRGRSRPDDWSGLSGHLYACLRCGIRVVAYSRETQELLAELGERDVWTPDPDGLTERREVDRSELLVRDAFRTFAAAYGCDHYALRRALAREARVCRANEHLVTTNLAADDAGCTLQSDAGRASDVALARRLVRESVTVMGGPNLLGLNYVAMEVKTFAHLKAGFPPDTDFTMNWCFFGTSGVHGSYGSIDDLFADPSMTEDHITVLVVRPRRVGMMFGHVAVRREDIPWLRWVADSTRDGLYQSQVGTWTPSRRDGP